MSSTIESNKKRALLPALRVTLEQLTKEFNQIPSHRKETLKEVAQFIQYKNTVRQKVYLNFICTHNSRRSQISQLWAQTAAYYYGIPGVECFSGGTESTAFNPRAVKAMQEAGFNITKTKEGDNPVYEVHFSNHAIPVQAFSKKYDDPFNPANNFAAIMTCSHADENCPLVLGASVRFSITYDDPKDFDGTPQETAIYKERVYQIGREILFTFSQVKV